MKYCANCGTKLEPGAAFCPHCGQKVGASQATSSAMSSKVVDQVKKSVTQVKTKANPQNKRRLIKWGFGVLVAILAVFFAYRLLYLPGVVKSAVDANVLNQGGYTAKANTMTKTVVISTDQLKLERLIGALKANDYDTTHIGAEEQLAKLEKALPGNWTVEITQHEMKSSQTVLWRYQGAKETIRYQNSEECKRAHKLVMEAKAKQQSENDAVTKGVTAGVLGGIVGGLLAR